MKPTDFIPEKHNIGQAAQEMHVDHEIQMAREACYNSASNAIELHRMLKQVSEQQGLEAWASEKITLANDYLRTVKEWLEYELMSDFEMSVSEQSDMFESKEKVSEKAVSQSQRRAAGIALAAKKGDIPKKELQGASKEMSKMSKAELEKFAKTKEKGLPKKVNEADTGEADARKTTPSSKEAQDKTFDRFRERSKKEKEEHEQGSKKEVNENSFSPKGTYFYNISPDEEDEARKTGLRQNDSGRWYSTFNNEAANKKFGAGKYFQKKPDMDEDASVGGISAGAVATGAAGSLFGGKKKVIRRSSK